MENLLKIAFICQPWDVITQSADASSSIAIITYQFARHLADSNEIIIYAKQGVDQPAEERDEHGILYRRIATRVDDFTLKPLRALERVPGLWNSRRPLFAGRFYYIGYALQVARDLRTRNCDIVHVCNFSQFIPLFQSLNISAKFVLHMQCEWLNQVDPRVTGPRLSNTDLIIGCSDYIVEKIQHAHPQVSERCRTVYNGVDTDLFGARTSSSQGGVKRLLFVARVSPEKGVHILLDAFERVIKFCPNVELDIVGPAVSVPFEFVVSLSEEEKVRDLASFYATRTVMKSGEMEYLPYLKARMSTDAASKVRFHGFAPHSQLAEFYRNADIFVFPSVWDEPFGMPLVEAMSSELPVIATRGGGITEIVHHGGTGFLVEKGDAAGLAQRILELLEDEQLCRQMGITGKQRACEQFSWIRTARSLLDSFEHELDCAVSLQSGSCSDIAPSRMQI